MTDASKTLIQETKHRQRRHRSAAYRARRRWREARRHLRAAAARDYQVMLERTVGYAAMLERYAEEDRAEEQWLEDRARFVCVCGERHRLGDGHVCRRGLDSVDRGELPALNRGGDPS